MRHAFKGYMAGAGACLMAAIAGAQTQLPPIFGDHMVLQRELSIPIWGKDTPGQKVIVTLAGKTAHGIADKDRKWKAILPEMKAGGPYEMTVQGSSGVTLKDVWVGEVWVASGQSNMELPLNNTLDTAKEVPSAAHPLIRWFVQDRRLSDHPEKEPIGTWKVCSPETAKDFSAAAYYFAKKISNDLKVPVGILGTYWGGTWIESWTPEESFQNNPAIKPILDSWNKLSPSERMSQCGLQEMKMEIKRLRVTSNDPSRNPVTLLSPEGSWFSNAQPGSAITFTVENKEGSNSDPVGQLKAEIQTGGWGNSTCSFKASGGSIDLSAYDTIEFEARGYGKLNAILEQPIVTDWDNYGSAPFTLTSDWKSYQIPFSSLKQSGWGKPEPFQPKAINAFCLNPCVNPMGMRPFALYNGMVSPMIPFGIRGVIWYQGETNVGEAEKYKELLPAMIQGWRKAWGEGDFPFLFAQLPNWHDPNAKAGNGWPELREAQASALSLPRTEMAVLIDSGDRNDIHPKNKSVVGLRLALAALHEAYGRKGAFSGPILESILLKEGKIHVRFKHLDGGFKVKGKQIDGFEIEDEKGGFIPAQAKIVGNEVLVWNDQIANPKGVRYAWAEDPKCDLFNGADLPAAPFRAVLPTDPAKPLK